MGDAHYLPQPALPEVPRVGACSMAGRPTIRVAAGAVLLRRSRLFGQLLGRHKL